MRQLEPWLAYVDAWAPELRARMRSAAPERIAALEARRGRPLPAIQREFLALVGGNGAGELDPLLANLEFDVHHMERRVASAADLRAIDLGDYVGWSCLAHTRDPLHPAELFLAPSQIGEGLDGELCVVTAMPAESAPEHVHVLNATLLEYLLLDAHCFVRRARCAHAAVFIVNPARDGEPRRTLRGRSRRDRFLTIVEGLGLSPVVGADRWWLGFESPDAAMWCYVGPQGSDCEVALMAEHPQCFDEYYHIIEDNLELHRIQ